MKKVGKVLLYLIIAVIVVIGGFAAYIQIDGIPKYEVEKVDLKVEVTPERVALGQKIAAVQCMVCHRGSDGKLSGRLISELPPEFGEIHSANITQSKEQGIANWTDGQIYYLLRTGCKPDGQYLPVYMPKFPHMSETDIQSVIAWLRSQSPEVQASEIAKVPSKPSFLVKFLSHVAFKKIPLNKAPIADPDTNNLPGYGHYLVTGRYDCYPCHSADFKTLNMEFPEKTPGFCGGGNAMITMNGNLIYTANITPEEKTGIGTWTEEDLATALRNSKNKDGKTLRNPMLPYNGLTDLEVKAIFKYLKTVPTITNTVQRQWDKEDL
jgi:mono/diheme cytochrome c family protein